MGYGSESLLTGSFINYTYSSENQLVKIEEYKNNALQKTSNYFYDASGRRFKKEVVDHQNSANSYTRKYQYDGQEILAELDEYNSTLAVYTHSMLRTDDVLSADIRSTKLANQEGSYFYLKDALGSIIDVADSSGNLVQHYAYSAFGKILSIEDQSGIDVMATPLIKTSYTYTNREYDEESGMYYYRARYYEPSIGRFIQEDPHPGLTVFPVTNFNKYLYTANNPLKYKDPSGKFFVTAFVVGAIIGGLFSSMQEGANLESVLKGAFYGGVASVAGAFVGSLVAGSGLLASMFSGALAGSTSTAVGLALQGENPFDRRNIWKVALGGAIGAVGGAIGYYMKLQVRGSKLDNSGKIESALEKTIDGLGEGYSESGQAIFKTFEENILLIECSIFLGENDEASFNACMGGN